MNYLRLSNGYNGITVRAVIEVPKGSHVRTEVQNYSPGLFPVTKIHPIPFIANYGFIPSTLDGDGDCLDVYVIGETLPAKWVGFVYPRLCIDFEDTDGQDYKIIAVKDPYESSERVQEAAEAICGAMGLEVTAIQDINFAKEVIVNCSI